MAELDPQKVSFNIFSETTKDNIKVGYISTDRDLLTDYLYSKSIDMHQKIQALSSYSEIEIR